MTTQQQISNFLSLRTLALVGVSRNEKDLSRHLLRDFRAAGQVVHGITPHAAEIAGESCFASLRDMPIPVDGALLMLSPAALPTAIRDCVEAGVKNLWIYGVGRPQPLDEATLQLCREHGVSLINGFCPLMFLRSASWPHHLHGWFARHSQAYRNPVPA